MRFGALNLHGLAELVGFEAGIERFLNFSAACEVGFAGISATDGGDEALVDIRRFRGLEGFPFGFVDVLAEADFEFVVGFIEVEAERALRAVDAKV